MQQELPQEAVNQAQFLRKRSNRAVAEILLTWKQQAREDFSTAFIESMPSVLDTLDTAQEELATFAMETTPQVMAAMSGSNPAPPAYTVSPSQWVGYVGNGDVSLDNLMPSLYAGKNAITQGLPVQTAISRISNGLAERSRTLLADTFRSASIVSAKSRHINALPVRVLTPPSCKRCLMLAGMQLGDFQRHPHCDCTVAWTDDPAVAKQHLDDPIAYLESLPEREAARIMGSKANLHAVLDGADIKQIVNAYRRKGSVSVAQTMGRNIKYTTEGMTKRGSAASRMRSVGFTSKMTKHGRYERLDRPRLMPETIYKIADGDQAKARDLLYKYAWIL